jgi:hypothetical protein
MKRVFGFTIILLALALAATLFVSLLRGYIPTKSALIGMGFPIAAFAVGLRLMRGIARRRSAGSPRDDGNSMAPEPAPPARRSEAVSRGINISLSQLSALGWVLLAGAAFAAIGTALTLGFFFFPPRDSVEPRWLLAVAGVGGVAAGILVFKGGSAIIRSSGHAVYKPRDPGSA